MELLMARWSPPRRFSLAFSGFSLRAMFNSSAAVPPSLGGHRRSHHGIASLRGASRSSLLGAPLAARLPQPFGISFSPQRSGDLAPWARRFLGDSRRSRSPAPSFFRDPRYRLGGIRMARANGTRRLRPRPSGLSFAHRRFRRFAPHPFPQPRKPQGQSPRRAEPHPDRGSGGNRGMVALAGAAPSFRKSNAKRNGPPLAALHRAHRSSPAKLPRNVIRGFRPEAGNWRGGNSGSGTCTRTTILSSKC